MINITFDSATLDNASVQYVVVYGPQPRWFWCRALPKTWQWAWPNRLVAYYDLSEQPTLPEVSK